MAGNPIPIGQDELLTMAEDIADGCHNHEVAIGILQKPRCARPSRACAPPWPHPFTLSRRRPARINPAMKRLLLVLLLGLPHLHAQDIPDLTTRPDLWPREITLTAPVEVPSRSCRRQ
jgi:hypothetical protein